MTSTISQLSIYVKNVEQSLAWYVTTFSAKIKMLSADKHYGELDLGNFTLAFGQDEMERQHNYPAFYGNSMQQEPCGINLAVYTNDLEGQYQQALLNGAVSVLAPHTKPWGIEVAWIRDINGVMVSIVKTQNY